MRARALILFVYAAAVFALGYGAAEWSWWLLAGLPVLLFSYGWLIARSYRNPRSPGERVVERELY